jgi:hypothetical protein
MVLYSRCVTNKVKREFVLILKILEGRERGLIVVMADSGLEEGS